MASALCGFCERYSHMTVMWAEMKDMGTSPVGVHIYRAQGVAKCDHCGRASVGVTLSANQSAGHSSDFLATAPDDSIVWFPRVGLAPEFPDVPAHVERAAKEAHAAESIKSFMSAILMARTVVEATAKEKGITKGNLLSKIDELAGQGIIRNDTKDAAHEIRHLGNDMAHGDISDVPNAEDVADVLALMDEVLNEVFQGPAKTARLRARRANPSL